MLIKVKDHVFNTSDIVYVKPQIKQSDNKSGMVVKFRNESEEYFDGICADDFMEFMNLN